MAFFVLESSTAGSNLQIVRSGFAAAHVEAEKLGVLAALGKEEDRVPSGVHCGLRSPRLSAGGENVSWRGLSAPACDRNHPDVAFGAIGGGIA